MSDAVGYNVDTFLKDDRLAKVVVTDNMECSKFLRSSYANVQVVARCFSAVPAESTVSSCVHVNVDIVQFACNIKLMI